MSELIRREDAINAVEMFFKDAYIEDADVHCTDMVYEIDHIPTASPWRRVEDGLPVKGEIVIVSDGKRTWDVGQYHCLFSSDDRTKWWWKGHTIKTVKWWMRKKDALPEPPKEDE